MIFGERRGGRLHGRAMEGVAVRPPRESPVGAEALAKTLAENVEGEVRFGDGDRALYAADAGNYRQVPIGVVIPRTVEDVERTLAICRGFGVPILARGGGTSLAGQSCNVAVVMDFSKYLHEVLEIDRENRRARVQPGTILDHLNDLAQRHGLTFGPDPATHEYCTIGGMIGNNSCGVHSVLSEFYGPGARMEDNVEELEILTYDGVRMRVGPTSGEELERIVREGGRKGEIYAALRDLRDRYADLIRERFPDIPRRVSGFNLPALLPENGFNVAHALVGSECTCAIILEATLTLVRHFPARALLVLGYPSVYEAGDHIPEIRRFEPIGIEGMDHRLAEYMRRKRLRVQHLELLPEGDGWLLVEFGGEDREEAQARAREVMEALERHGDAPTMKLYSDPAEQTEVWKIRESGLGATAFVPSEPDAWPGWEDSAVPPDRVGDYLRDLRGLFEKYGYSPSLYGHFGQGCVHTRIDFDLVTAEGIRDFKSFTREAAELVSHHYGGSLSGEHGDGQARADLLPVMYGEELMEAFREFKRIWDPDGRLNPGKVIDARRRDQDLRLGTDYNPWRPETHFRYPQDEGDFARAALRCVGVGKCRRTEGGTMCPSYMVLREEKHTTRGRAHLLFEMLQGDPVREGWRDEAVRESLDLCLSCKGCTGECPVNVDIPTYKAEFLAHYYEGRLRPRHQFAFGLIHWWARLASRAPRLVNLAAGAPVLRDAAKWAAGMAPERDIPRFAGRSFRDWWRERAAHGGARDTEARTVILWADTFNTYFRPEVARAAVEVLEDAGCRVVVPERALCCGRPLYEYGMLDLAKRQLRQILAELRPEIRAGMPVVGLEPSCVAVFRDELCNLFPHDEDADRLSVQTLTLAEFLERIDYEPPRLERRALVHGHCHHKSVLKRGPDEALMERMGLDVEVLDSGCCGMAGAFGYEAGEKYEVSVAAGERVLLPAVRDADADTLILTDGFSCQSQIAQRTGREALHLAEVIRIGLRRGTPATRREEAGTEPDGRAGRRAGALAAGGAGLLLGGILTHQWTERRKR
jgi:FAD/FMN-containing dehydrogenase/Fe-S oxidoreductase